MAESSALARRICSLLVMTAVAACAAMVFGLSAIAQASARHSPAHHQKHKAGRYMPAQHKRPAKHEGVPANAHRLPHPKPVRNIGGAIPPDQYLPFATGARIRVSQGASMPCGHGWDHVSSSCNSYYGPYNQYAWDFAVPTGTVIHAAIGGIVIRAGSENGGYGNTIVVQTGRGDCSRYEHLSRIGVRVGQSVGTYDVLGNTGMSGNVTGPHLHYGREDCRTARSLQSAFVDAGDPSLGAMVTSSNNPGAGVPAGGTQPVSCPPNCFVYGASAGVNIRKAPSLSAPVLGVLADHTSVAVVCQIHGDNVAGSSIWDQLSGGGFVADYYVNTPVTGGFSPGVPQCSSTASSGSSPAPDGSPSGGSSTSNGGSSPAPGGSPSGGSTPPAPNRQTVTSYNRMQPGASHNGVFANAWQAFTAQSNTITSLGVTVGKLGYSGGLTVNIRLCTNQPDVNGNCNVIAQSSPSVVNYGDSQGDIGDAAVTPGSTYWIVYFPPQAYGNGWVTYWWAGGSTASTSDQIQAIVQGYNR